MKNIERYRDTVFPNYLFSQRKSSYTLLSKLGFFFFKPALSWVIKTVLRPRKEKPGSLNQAEVERVYQKEAKTYDLKHHMTTRGMDLFWRRWAGQVLVNYVNNIQSEDIKVIDLCTGTGLTSVEIVKVCQEWNCQYSLYGVDYCTEMLKIAKSRNLPSHVQFVRGDATNLCDNREPGFKNFAKNSIDFVSQVFGIGGIDRPLSNFKEILKVLKINGQYAMIDMHVPIESLPGEWPFLFKWWRMPILEKRVYQEVTIPLALKTLWAWRDTTWLFYVLRLITLFDQGKYYGFKVQSFNFMTERWWLALPIMPIAKIVVEKQEINQEEAKMRQYILENI
jgi:ubiquinone/menaquinone biosynthesis C-methylase UbiE